MSRFQFSVRILLALGVVAVLGASMFTFQVSQNEFAVVTRFGRPVRVLRDPGLYPKLCWPLDRVHRFDRRLAFTEARLSEALTRDRRNVILPFHAAWRVEDPLRCLEAIGDPAQAPAKLDGLITSARNAVLGRYDFAQLVSSDPAKLALAEIEAEVLALVQPQAASAFGLSIESVGLERVALPEANTLYVFERMRAERAQFAAQARAEGRREADDIRARTDADRTVLLADARKYAEETRGRAEAEAAHIYADAHGRGPEFYRYLRELQLLETVAKENTTVILDAESAPFRLLKNPGAEAVIAPTRSDKISAQLP